MSKFTLRIERDSTVFLFSQTVATSFVSCVFPQKEKKKPLASTETFINDFGQTTKNNSEKQLNKTKLTKTKTTTKKKIQSRREKENKNNNKAA